MTEPTAVRVVSQAVPGLVSVIVPVFNRLGMLREAVQCVRAQTYRPVELLLVDDGSTDGTGELCEQIAAENPGWVRVVHRPNGGPGAARETGREHARGEFIQYLDSDDWLHPRKLEIQVGILLVDQEAGICYGPTREYRMGEPIQDIPSARTGEKLVVLFPTLLGGRCWQTVTPLWRRTVVDAIGPWTTLRHEEDWEYDARAGALKVKLAWCQEFLADFRHHTAPRASKVTGDVAPMLRARCEAHRLIYEHARSTGVETTDPFMQRYSRELFLLARQVGSAGLQAEASLMFALARDAAGEDRGSGIDFLVFEALAKIIGWKRLGQLALAFDRLR